VSSGELEGMETPSKQWYKKEQWVCMHFHAILCQIRSYQKYTTAFMFKTNFYFNEHTTKNKSKQVENKRSSSPEAPRIMGANPKRVKWNAKSVVSVSTVKAKPN